LRQSRFLTSTLFFYSFNRIGDMTTETVSEDFNSYLLRQKLVSETELAKAERYSKETGEPAFAALRKMSALPPQALAKAISRYFCVPLVEADQWQRASQLTEDVSQAFLRENNVFPLEDIGEGILLAMEDPSDQHALNAMKLALGRPVLPRVASAEDIQSAIERAARERSQPSVWVDAGPGEDGDSDIEHIRDMALGTPVIRFVNIMIEEAVHSRATDIHIEPFDGRLAIRMRVDGMLREIVPPPVNMARAIVSRVKILAGMNIAERRLPQDGRARVRINQRRLDLRIATMPTIHGEAVAIRLLDNVRRALDFGKLGFSAHDEAVLRKHLSAPYGLILVTGPTGSGKTTTLATALSILNEEHRKILTIEDPIEYELDGVNQTQAKPSIGLTFANALRSFLRHDPDVLMVGEMRDGETAGIGIHAALTGHLVLSTLHTNSAAGAIPRLLDMGVEAFLLASSLRCIVGQRLVRVLCAHCKQPGEARTGAPERDGQASPPEQAWRAIGCSRCFGTGYADRIAISEVLDVDAEVRKLIRPDANPTEIEQVACRQGMTTMVADGFTKCRQGLTTPEEVYRVALDI
jgi:general secretion pathway protein E